MQLRDYIIRRLIALPILLLGVSIIVFSLTRIAGSPVGVYLSHEMSQEEVLQIEQRYNLDKPLPVQYAYWLRGVFQGDFGWSGVASAPVAEVFPAKFAATMELSVAAAVVAVALGLWLAPMPASGATRCQTISPGSSPSAGQACRCSGLASSY